jgi:hypothetical protein
MARRRVLLFLKPFDVYPPRPYVGAAASSPTSAPSSLPQPRAANPKVAPLSLLLSCHVFDYDVHIACEGLERGVRVLTCFDRRM